MCDYINTVNQRANV